MDYFLCYWFTLVLLLSSFTGADVIIVTVPEGEDCALPCSRNTTLELSLLEWSHSGLEVTLLVFRGRRVMFGYEDPLYRNRVELLDPQLLTDLSVVLKKVTVEDSGVYKCQAVYEDGQKMQEISQLIRLTVTEPGTTNTETPPETNTELSLGLILVPVFGLCALILVIALCVWFLKQFKDKLCYSKESLSL